MENKEHKEIDEVKDEIESALKDPRGLIAHKKRLALFLSMGAVNELENYLAKKGVLKQGHKINHQWLKKKKENVKQILALKIIAPIDSLKELDKILDIIYEIESERNELAYGKKVSEKILSDLINKYFELKKEVGKSE